MMFLFMPEVDKTAEQEYPWLMTNFMCLFEAKSFSAFYCVSDFEPFREKRL